MIRHSRSPGYADMPAFAYWTSRFRVRMQAYVRASGRGLAHAIGALAVKVKSRRFPCTVA